jgi:hypothetical protein
MGLASKNKASREERERLIKLKYRFENRITTARFGKESLDAGDYANALKNFSEYLNILADINEIRDIYALRVAHFDPKRQITELLMISHIFFEMARLYDAVPKFHTESQKCLEQFVHFSANQPYQVVNSEMIRKYLKKSTFKNPDAFRNAYQQIHVQSKKCYIVTFCYGDHHPVTADFRLFKEWLLSFNYGFKVVEYYYRFSSVLVDQCQHRWWLKITGRLFIRPLLLLVSKTLLPVIIK